MCPTILLLGMLCSSKQPAVHDTLTVLRSSFVGVSRARREPSLTLSAP